MTNHLRYGDSFKELISFNKYFFICTEDRIDDHIFKKQDYLGDHLFKEQDYVTPYWWVR